ncbi:hypothetical protein CUC08_Gglean007710 [Alternaria sp. MG1]|nr:hypothetical protein CUC08_Gglean007710 [Alternaria sp. MG1]
MPSTFLNSRSRTRGPSDHGMLLYNLPFAIDTRAKGDKLQIDNDDDDADSEEYIPQEQSGKGEITKTIVNELRSDDRNSVQVPERAYNACH